MMGSLVKKMGEIVARETRYVEKMPLTTFFNEDTTVLLEEVNSLVECQVNFSFVAKLFFSTNNIFYQNTICFSVVLYACAITNN